MKKLFFFVLLSASILMLTGCIKGCPLGGRETVSHPGMILKYKQGAEFPDYFHTNKANLRSKYSKPELGLYPLVNGYYIHFGGAIYNDWQYKDVVIMDFTLEDYNNNNIPEDWLDHWEDHVFVENPFCYGGALPFYLCKLHRGVPYYCEKCTNTSNIDTSCINRLIVTDEIWNYTVFEYYDTTAIEEVQR